MMRRFRAVFIALIVFAGGMHAAYAESSVPAVLPDWQQQIDASPCNPSADGRLYMLDARAGVGALLQMPDRLTVFIPKGELRWQASFDCADTTHAYWERAILTPDGGAWAVAVDPSEDYDGERTLQRFDAQGQVQMSVDLDLESSDGYGVAMFGDDNAVVYMVISTHGQVLEWRRFDAVTGMLDMRSHQLSDQDLVSLPARPLTNGGVGVLQQPPAQACEFICVPSPYPRVARVSPQGNLLWRVHSNDSGVALLDADGGAFIIGGIPPEDTPYLRRITPSGEVEPDIALPELVGRFREAYGPHAGRVTIQTSALDDAGTHTISHLWSIDQRGNPLADRVLDQPFHIIDDFDAGLLLIETDVDAGCLQWLDPHSLDTRACFRFDPENDGNILSDSSRFLSDGTLYATFSKTADNEETRLVLAHYDAPSIDPPDETGTERRHCARAARAHLGQQP